MDAVTVRMRWWIRLALVPIAGIGVVIWAAVVGILVGRTHTGVGALGTTLIVALLLFLAVLITYSALGAWLMKQTFTATEIRVRTFWRTRVIELATASRIRQVRAAIRTGRRTVPLPRLQVVGDESRGLPVRAQVDATLVHAEEAMAVLDEWVRRRPELVDDDPDGARRWFQGRRVISAPTQ